MFDNYPRLTIFIGLILIILQAVYATAVGTWLILQFGFPVTSGLIIFLLGYVFLGFVAKLAVEIITILFTITLMFKT